MPINLASPGIKVREVDLTAGRVDPTSDAIGGLVAPFARGPVEDPILIRNENALLNTFSGPSPVDKHYESWMVASSFLAYGSQLRVLRSDSTLLKNANDQGVSLKVKSTDDYNFKGYDESPITGTTVVARNPGSWANGVKVAIIDSGTVITEGSPKELIGKDATSGITIFLSESFQGLESVLHDYTYTDDDKRIHFSTKDPEGDMPKIIRILSESGAHIQRIETDKSSLEDVFLNLTGKGINK